MTSSEAGSRGAGTICLPGTLTSLDAHTLPDCPIIKTGRLRPLGTEDFAKLHSWEGLEEVVSSGFSDLEAHVLLGGRKGEAGRVERWRCEVRQVLLGRGSQRGSQNHRSWAGVGREEAKGGL